MLSEDVLYEGGFSECMALERVMTEGLAPSAGSEREMDVAGLSGGSRPASCALPFAGPPPPICPVAAVTVLASPAFWRDHPGFRQEHA